MLSGWVYDMRPVCLRLVCSPIKVLILFQYCYYFHSISILIYYMLNVTISIMLTFRNCEQSTFWNQVGLGCVIKPGITRRVICQSLSTWEWTTGPAHPAPPPHLSRRHTGVEPVTNSCEKSSWLPSAARFEGWSGVERGLGLQSRLIAGVSPIAAILRRRLWASPDWCNTHQWWRQSRFTGGRVSVRQKVLIYFYVLPILSNRRLLTSGSVSREA